MPYTIGLLEGFQGAREANIKQQQDQDAARREQEGKIYQYLLSSADPDMRALAISGMFESAAPGQKGKGLAGYLGQLQGGQIYPQVRARMNEMIPDIPAEPTGPAAPATPGSAGMSTNTPVKAGSAPIGGGMLGVPLPPEAPPAGGAPPVNDGGAAAGPNMGAGPGAAPLGPPPEPPVSQFHRRGTGVPTAEEIAEHTQQAELQNKIKTISAAILANGGTAQDVQRAVLGIAGAPQSPRQFTAPTFAVQGPNGEPVPVSFDVTTGKYAYPDGSPVPATAKFVRMPSSAGSPPSTKVPDKNSPTGWSRVYHDPADGHELYREADTPFVPPPDFSGTTTTLDAAGNPTVSTIPRSGGPPGPKNVLGPAAGGGPTQEQSNATALLATVDKAIADAEAPQYNGDVKHPLTPKAKDDLVRTYATQGKMPYTSYLEVQQAARQQRRPSPTPTTPKPEGTPGGGGSALSIADQVRADLLTRQGASRGSTAAVPPPPPVAPARATGPGPNR